MEGTEKLVDGAGEASVANSHEVSEEICPTDISGPQLPGISEDLYATPPGSDEEPASQTDLFIAETLTEPKDKLESTASLKAVIEAAIYVTDEPLSPEQIASAVGRPLEEVKQILMVLTAEYAAPDRGLSLRELAGGYKMSTKPEHHEAIRLFVKRLQPPLKLSLPALETLAVIAYKQPITAPEIMDIRGVQGAGVLKTLLDRKLIATAGRKNVLGKPIMYRTTREFLVQFGLSSLAELPTLKEFEELGRMALTDSEREEEFPQRKASASAREDEPAHAEELRAAEPEMIAGQENGEGSQGNA
jgi:segregation and condensation protein B